MLQSKFRTLTYFRFWISTAQREDYALDLTTYLLTSLVLFCGAFVQGVIGFGFNVMGVPFITILAGPKMAVSLISVPSQINCLVLVWRIRRKEKDTVPLNFGPLLPLLLMGGIGTFAGATLLVALDPSIVLTCLGVLIMLFVFTDNIRKNWRPSPKYEKQLAFVVGAVTGVLNGLAGICGPTLAPYFYTLRLDKHQFVYYLNVIFLFFGAYQWISFFALGLYTWERILLGLSFLPLSLTAIWLGERARYRVSPVFFNRLILVVLFITALDLLRRGLHLF